MRIGRTIFSEERAFIAARYLSGEYKPRLRPRSWHNQSQSISCKGGLLECDFDDDPDELDTSTSLELRQRADPRYLAKVAKRLDVVWKVSSKKGSKPGQCACCGGSGRGCCSFCKGSGALTLGDHVFCSIQEGCKPCPVCNSKGAIKCEHCSGTGFRAAWMEDPVCSTDPTAARDWP